MLNLVNMKTDEAEWYMYILTLVGLQSAGTILKALGGFFMQIKQERGNENILFFYAIQ